VLAQFQLGIYLKHILSCLLQTALAYARIWHHVDAEGRILGQLASRIALVLMGKHKPIFDRGGV
jgi:ribosomal protein L13